MVFLSAASLLLAFTSYVASKSCPDSSAANYDYDYVVVGSGAGGGPVAARLAEAGHSVLVVDAGHDINNFNTTIPLYFLRSVEDPQLELSYTLAEYPDGFKYQRDDSWYPRAGALGGSTIHNAMINIIAGTRPDFDGLSTMFNDSTWSRDNMQEYYKKIERAVYPLPSESAQDHGTDGWLQTNINPIGTIDPKFLDQELGDYATAVISSGPPLADINSLTGDGGIGSAPPIFTVTSNYSRSSIRDRLVEVQRTSGALTFQLDTLATKILTCTDEAGKPKAYGVEIAPGATLPVAITFGGKADELKTRVVTAKREVIVSAGTFQSPQLLMLSGIGDREQLQKFGIEPIVHLPGVGTNMQDHDEIAVIWQLKENFTIAEGCTFLSDPEQDPCLEYYLSGKPNLYSFGAALATVVTKSREEYAEPDMLTYWAPAYFPGFVHGFGQAIPDHPGAVSVVQLKAHPSSKGTVRLTGSHPQDLLNIEKNQFQDPVNGVRDVEDLRNAIKRSREVMSRSPIATHVLEEIFPGGNSTTDEQIDDHIYRNIFGHHMCCTNSMGPDDDELAVLDGDFRVRGVSSLRVVDASSWPTVPGFFVTTPFYMGAEKAADSILADARA